MDARMARAQDALERPTYSPSTRRSAKGHAMRSTSVLAAALVLAAAAASGKPVNESSQLPAENPFARESTLPYSLPPLHKIKDEHFKPALLAGMAEQRTEIDAMNGAIVRLGRKHGVPTPMNQTVMLLIKAKETEES